MPQAISWKLPPAKAEFEAIMQYRSEKDILDAYGWGFNYLALFREGEDHAPTDVSKGPEGRNTSWDHVQLGYAHCGPEEL